MILGEGETRFVQHGIVPALYPITYIVIHGITCSAVCMQGSLHLTMSVAKDGIVERFLRQYVFGILVDAFLFVAAIVLLRERMLLAAVAAPAGGDAEANPWMKESEESLVELVAKDMLKEYVVGVIGLKAVSMAQEKSVTVELHDSRFSVHDGTNFFLKIVKHPHVVVADKVVYLHAAVVQPC